MNLCIILGTTRPNSNSQKVANFALQVANKENNVNAKLVDIKDLNIVDDGNSKDKNYTSVTSWANAFLIVVPEYNHSFPGGLKRVLDSEFANYKYKPVGLIGVSSGIIGGARAIEHLIPVLRELSLIISSKDVLFPNVNDTFNKEGNLNKEYIKQKERIKDLVNELRKLSKALKQIQ